MKKYFVYFISIFIVLLFFRQSAVKVYLSKNSSYNIGIESITVSSLKEYTPSYDILFDLFSHEQKMGWTEKLRQKMHNDENAYLIVSIRYTIKNNSQNIIMQKINFRPKFQNKLKSRIKAYNIDNDTYLLNSEPGFSCGMTQHIIIKKDGMSDTEVYKKILKTQVVVGWNAGIQKNKYELWASSGQQEYVKIEDILNH